MYYDRMRFSSGIKTRSVFISKRGTPCACVCSAASVASNSVTRQAPLCLGFSRQEYWSGLPCPPPGDLPKPGIKLTSFMCPAVADGFFTTESPGKPLQNIIVLGWRNKFTVVQKASDKILRPFNIDILKKKHSWKTRNRELPNLIKSTYKTTL